MSVAARDFHRERFAEVSLAWLFALIAGFDVAQARAADGASIRGAIVDPLGARVTGATVKLLRDGQVVKDTTSDAQGGVGFDGLSEGRYQLQAGAAGFQERTTSAMFVGAGAQTTVEVTLSVGTIEADVTVTAAATPGHCLSSSTGLAGRLGKSQVTAFRFRRTDFGLVTRWLKILKTSRRRVVGASSDWLSVVSRCA